MSDPFVNCRLSGARYRPLVGGWFLLSLYLSACATSVPRSSATAGGRNESLASSLAPEQRTVFFELEFMESGLIATGPVPIHEAEFKRAVQRLALDIHLGVTTPRDAARELLHLSPPPTRGVETVVSGGTWNLEVYGEQGYTLLPEKQDGPVSLIPEADDALKAKYLKWCARQGGGDCLGLLDDGPYLRTDDRRSLALALAFGSVLDETRSALGRELNARALVSLVVWTVALYCMMWLVPEPTTKAVAATLTVVLMGWLGLRTVYGLMDGWARMATAAHESSTFEELRAAGEEFGKTLGEDAARAMILAVATLTGRTLGEVAAKVKTLPGYGLAGQQWGAQGGVAALTMEAAEGLVLARDGALAQAVVAAESVALSPQGPFAVVMFKKGSHGGSEKAPGGRSCETIIRHRGGNRQVELSDGQRWHLPRGRPVEDLPAEDKVGDQLQEMVSEAASRWSPRELSNNERIAIERATEQGEYWLARLLEREARGRFVHEIVRERLQGMFRLRFNSRGADVIDLDTNRQYEILSGTASNLARHGRRMSGELFRMLTF